jgi:hypothetical protein
MAVLAVVIRFFNFGNDRVGQKKAH